MSQPRRFTAEQPLRLHLLGGPYVLVAGNRREIPPSAQRLLAYVALKGRVERRCAATALWPVGGEQAAGNLRSALWRVRNAGIDVIIPDRHTLALRPGAVVDVHLLDEWTQRVMAGRLRPGDGTPSPFWTEALHLLPGWQDDWALLERERLRQRLLHALDALSLILTAAGRGPEAVDVAVAAVSAEPLRESAQRALLLAHLGEGNHGEARRAFVTFRSLLRRELGIEPSPDLVAMVGTAPGARHRPSRTSPTRGRIRRVYPRVNGSRVPPVSSTHTDLSSR